MDNGIECTFIKSAYDTRLSDAADMLEDREAIERDIDKT